MDRHERKALESRLAKVIHELDRIPKGMPDPKVIEDWRTLLEEKELLESQLATIDGKRASELV